jgi:hypothetical protein
VREFKRGVQNIFSLIDEKKTLSIYLYVKSPNLPPDKIASILVNLVELDKIETIGASTRYVRIITRKEPITKLGRENNFENLILIRTPKDGFSINFNESNKISHNVELFERRHNYFCVASINLVTMFNPEIH